MKKIIFSSLMLLGATAMSAQETYESATIADKDLNGTARYVGMGGAMEALGADISTIGTNPAGIGLLRKGQVSATVGVQSNPTSGSVDGKTKVGFEQIGAVINLDSDDDCIINAGFNYHKSKNFNSILSAANSLHGASQNKLSYLKGYCGVFYPDWDSNDNIIGWEHSLSNYTANAFTQTDFLYYNNFLYDSNVQQFTYENAKSFEMGKDVRGSVQDYDFNLSAGFNNRFYLGLTIGLQSVNYKADTQYAEQLESGGYSVLNDYRHIDGTGVNVKAGFIWRPIETSAFRVGGYFHTPTWYKLTTENITSLATSSIGVTQKGSVSESYDFHLNTPWTFGLSLGHTIGTQLALGATYEYSDYRDIDNRVIDGGYYDYYDNYQDETSSDKVMNDWTEDCLKGVHTLKLGAEYKPVPQIAIRAGYNYVSPKYSVDGYKDGTINSYATFYSSQTDYINWKATNRFTLGFGYTAGKLSFDLAYQYSNTKGEYFPFMSYYDDDASSDLNNICDVTNIANKRHNVSATLTYRF